MKNRMKRKKSDNFVIFIRAVLMAIRLDQRKRHFFPVKVSSLIGSDSIPKDCNSAIVSSISSTLKAR